MEELSALRVLWTGLPLKRHITAASASASASASTGPLWVGTDGGLVTQCVIPFIAQLACLRLLSRAASMIHCR